MLVVYFRSFNRVIFERYRGGGQSSVHSHQRLDSGDNYWLRSLLVGKILDYNAHNKTQNYKRFSPSNRLSRF